MAQTPKRWFIMNPPSKRHLGSCAIHSETTVYGIVCVPFADASFTVTSKLMYDLRTFTYYR